MKLLLRMLIAMLAVLSTVASPSGPAWATDASAAREAETAREAEVQPDSAPDTLYRFGPGDKLRVRIYNEDTISGDYEVDGTGSLSVQLLGPINAAGLSLVELSEQIAARLKAEGYMLNPRVAIEVLNYRPFYVLGEVNRPGSYPYVSGMTVLNAIALAGGYTYRAKRSRMRLIRGKDEDQALKVVPGDVVMPGDIITVEERFF